MSAAQQSGSVHVSAASSDGALPEDAERVEVEIRGPEWLAELHREIGDAGISAILRLQLRRGLVATPTDSESELRASHDRLKEVLTEAERLYTNYGLIAGQIEGEPMCAGKWINAARAAISSIPESLK